MMPACAARSRRVAIATRRSINGSLFAIAIFLMVVKPTS